jgi:hypothetical protein
MLNKIYIGVGIEYLEELYKTSIELKEKINSESERI